MLDSNDEKQLSDIDLANATGGRQMDSDRTHGMYRLQCGKCNENFWAMRGQQVTCPNCGTVIDAT